MAMKVKRGLGLLVVAVICWFVTFAALQGSSLPVTLIALVFGIVALVTFFGGLGLLAWGLLRD